MSRNFGQIPVILIDMKKDNESEEKTQWLNVQIAFAEDPSSVPGNYRVAHNYLELQFQGTWNSLLIVPKHQTHTRWTLLHSNKPHIHIKIISTPTNRPRNKYIAEEVEKQNLL